MRRRGQSSCARPPVRLRPRRYSTRGRSHDRWPARAGRASRPAPAPAPEKCSEGGCAWALKQCEGVSWQRRSVSVDPLEICRKRSEERAKIPEQSLLSAPGERVLRKTRPGEPCTSSGRKFPVPPRNRQGDLKSDYVAVELQIEQDVCTQFASL